MLCIKLSTGLFYGKIMKKYLLTVVVIFLVISLCYTGFIKKASSTVVTTSIPVSDNKCAAQIPYGQPVGRKQSTTVLCRIAYILEHDNNAKIPEWVAYVLTPEHAIGCNVRSNAFTSDKDLLPGKRSEMKDYSKSGYDIGHQANDSDMAWDVNVERQSFLLSNMAPQLPGFNRGIWKKLEDQTRGWVIDRQHPILIYVGPVYSTQDKTIGTTGVIVPHAFYKILIDTVTNEVMVFEFIHQSASGSLDQFITSLAKVQQDTGIVFPMPKNVKFVTATWSAKDKSAVKTKRGVCTLKPH